MPPPVARVIDYEQNSEDAPRGEAENSHGATTRAIRQFEAHTTRERSDTHETRRGFAGDVENPQGTATGALRHARNPQRFSPGNFQIRKVPQQERFDTHETRSVAEGSPVTLKIRAAPQRERSDTHETRKGLASTMPAKRTHVSENFRK